MAGPFHNNIKGTTAGTPGTSAFTPNAASSGAEAWSTVPAGWWGMVRYEDGSAWERQYSYWNGTTLSRASTQFVASSTGSALSLSSSATAELVADGSRLAPHLVVPTRAWIASAGATQALAVGLSTPTVTGTGSAGVIATTNMLTEQARFVSTSATTANAQAGVTLGTSTPLFAVNTSAGRGGGEMAFRFGCATLPTGPRVFMGMTSATFVANTAEPSAFTAHYAVLGLDSTDTNLQFLVNSNASGGTKTDTGIPLVANGVYECMIWFDPGGNTFKILLVRIDTGAIFYGTTSTDTPGNATQLQPQVLCGLSSTTGTAIALHFCQAAFRTGAI